MGRVQCAYDGHRWVVDIGKDVCVFGDKEGCGAFCAHKERDESLYTNTVGYVSS